MWYYIGEAQYKLPDLDRLNYENVPSDLDNQLQNKNFNLFRSMNKFL
jgi:hypothetical protein